MKEQADFDQTQRRVQFDEIGLQSFTSQTLPRRISG